MKRGLLSHLGEKLMTDVIATLLKMETKYCLMVN